MKSLFVWTCIFLSATATPVMAQSGTSVLGYDVYAGGIHAMDAQLTLKTSPKKYEIVLNAATQGVLKKLADWSGKFSANGLISKGIAYPLEHQSASTWKGSTESKDFKYDGKGGFVSYKVTEAGKDKTPADLDLSLAKGSIDLLSSTFRLMASLPATSACKGEDLIFDGDRNYRLVYKSVKTENLKRSDYNVYQGPSVVCTVEVIPEKGKWRKKPRGWLSIQEQGRQKGALPTIWFGKAKGNHDLYVPVKIQIKTDYGTLFMHLTSEKNG